MRGRPHLRVGPYFIGRDTTRKRAPGQPAQGARSIARQGPVKQTPLSLGGAALRRVDAAAADHYLPPPVRGVDERKRRARAAERAALAVPACARMKGDPSHDLDVSGVGPLPTVRHEALPPWVGTQCTYMVT